MEKFKDCYLKKEDKFFLFGNSKIERKIFIEKGNFFTISFYDKENKKEWIEDWVGENSLFDFSFDGLIGIKTGSELYFRPLVLKGVKVTVEKEISGNEIFKVIFSLSDNFSKTFIKRNYLLYPQLPYIIVESEILSENYPSGDFYKTRENIIDIIRVSKKIFYEGKSVEFFTRTDKTNQLIEEKVFNSSKNWDLRGNFIQIKDIKDNCGIFILKESPVSSDLRPEVSCDFEIFENNLKVMGWGIRPEDFGILKWRKSYKVVIGLFKGKEIDSLISLKKYQMHKYKFIPERDYMIMANPWGDGNVYNNLCEKFVLKELEGCYKFGITHYQIDDGWQGGGKAIDIINNKFIDKKFWKVDKNRFPHSFYKISERAKKLGITLGLWFVPNRNNQYKNYLQDVETILDFYKKFGIKVFKLDAINIQTKEAEENFELFLKETYEKSNGKIVFNFDVTGVMDRRPGYFYLSEYGNIFLENRYTNIKNDYAEKKYYPYKTLKNLWQLSKYVLPQKLQIEILNISLNKNQYSEKDILAPFNYDWEYCFGITMFSNPLFWGEISNFPEGALKRLKELILIYKKYRDEIFSSFIIPIGEIPNGFNWTGFIAYPENENKNGFIIVFRENNPKKFYEIYFEKFKNRKISLLYSSSDCNFSYLKDSIKIELEKPNSFALFVFK
jgi:hypothetical protein